MAEGGDPPVLAFTKGLVVWCTDEEEKPWPGVLDKEFQNGEWNVFLLGGVRRLPLVVRPNFCSDFYSNLNKATAVLDDWKKKLNAAFNEAHAHVTSAQGVLFQRTELAGWRKRFRADTYTTPTLPKGQTAKLTSLEKEMNKKETEYISAELEFQKNKKILIEMREAYVQLQKPVQDVFVLCCLPV